jgi:hypothetical protein
VLRGPTEIARYPHRPEPRLQRFHLRVNRTHRLISFT